MFARFSLSIYLYLSFSLPATVKDVVWNRALAGQRVESCGPIQGISRAIYNGDGRHIGVKLVAGIKKKSLRPGIAAAAPKELRAFKYRLKLQRPPC